MFFAAERVQLIASTINWRLSHQRFYALIPTYSIRAEKKNIHSGVQENMKKLFRAFIQKEIPHQYNKLQSRILGLQENSFFKLLETPVEN